MRERERESEINVRFLETIYAWRYIINESNLSRGWKFEIEGTTHFTFLRPRLFVARATISHSLPPPSLSLSLSLFFSFSKPRTCATVWTGWLNICYPAVPLSRISARVRKHRRRQPARVVARLRRMAPASRHFAGIFFFSFFSLPPFSPRSVKRDVPARNDARARDWCSSSRCLLDPKPRILLPGFAPGAISACPPASDTNRSRLRGVPNATEFQVF